MFGYRGAAEGFKIGQKFSEKPYLILGKYFLYVNALNTITCKFDDFVSLVREKINIEKYIAVTGNKEKEFRNK